MWSDVENQRGAGCVHRVSCNWTPSRGTQCCKLTAAVICIHWAHFPADTWWAWTWIFLCAFFLAFPFQRRAWLQYQHSRQERELSPLDVTLLAVINSFGFVRVGCHSIIKGVYGDNPLISPSTHSLSTRKQIASVLTERDCKGYPKLEG